VEHATLDALDRICADEVPAALIVEPLVLGAGGMLIYTPAVLREMRAICARHGVLFIADEVMTGWGRTGTLLACEQADVVPDILCLSKGITGGTLPLAVTVATPPIFEAHRSKNRADMFFHSSSYTANPIACAAANANLAIWREEPVLERSAGLCDRQQRHIEAVGKMGGVRNPRRIGTIAAFELDQPESNYLSDLGPRLMAHFRDRNLLVRPLGNTIYTMPPYCIGDDDLDSIHTAIADAVGNFFR
jgi:adenosylmethionine-8-amino-7-oxononanoate aminotransferase